MATFETQVVEKTVQASAPFECSVCHYRATATVTVKAEGMATVGATSENATAVAERRADWGAEKSLARELQLIRCPRCSAPDPVRLTRYRKGRAAVAAVMLAFGAAWPAFGLLIGEAGFVRLGWLVAGMLALCALQPFRQALRPPAANVSFR